MRILFWSGTFWPYIGGVEVLGAKLLPKLKECGYEFAVITSLGNRELLVKDSYKAIPVYRFPFWQALSRRNIEELATIKRQVSQLKRDFRADLIHINSVGLSTIFHLETLAALNTTTLVTVHQNLTEQTVDTLQGKIVCSADWVACVSNDVLNHVRRLVPDLTSRSSTIYNGLEMPAETPLPLPLDRPRLLCLGRLIPDKGYDVAIAALALLISQFPALRLTIAGEGQARPALEQQVVDLGLADSVEFTGWINPEVVPKLINRTTILLVPSRSSQETFSLVALQAAQMARPVIASSVGGLPEVVADRESGLLVPKENSHALAEAVAFLLEQPEVASHMGQVAQKRAQKHFSLELHVAGYNALYQQLKLEKRSTQND